MQRRGEKVGWSTATLGFAALALSAVAFAAPPQGRSLPPSQLTQSQLKPPAPHLDLRAPSHVLEGSGAEPASSAFPSHRKNIAAQLDLPALGLDGMHARPTVQDFVRRVHREGLPVARLFETKGALVHLGLNPKGKPGLWLVQKTH
jgi:hypothetical protein